MSAKVSFRVTTYFKRPRGEAGMTQRASQILSLGEALDWVIGELPEDAVTVTPLETYQDAVQLVIDWAKVPMEIRDGRR